MNAVADQKRTDVRGDISFDVGYQILTPEEYHLKRNTVEQIVYRDQKTLKIEAVGTDNGYSEIATNPWLIDFLHQMDEKLNLILSLLSDEETSRHPLDRGKGRNISGSGMKMTVDRPAELEQIVHIDFVLSRFPYVRINLFGKIIRITPLKKSHRVTYDLGIHFLEPDERAIEQIVTHVFQLQRKAIRDNRKST